MKRCEQKRSEKNGMEWKVRKERGKIKKGIKRKEYK